MANSYVNPAANHSSKLWVRKLSPNELSYFLPSRADRTNDVYFSAEFFTLPTLMTPERILIAWTILRIRHPLLAARVELDSSLLPTFDSMDSPAGPKQISKNVLEAYYRSASFVLEVSQTAADTLQRTKDSGSLDIRYLSIPSPSSGFAESNDISQQQGQDREPRQTSSATLVNEFINGPPLLSVDCLAGLIVTTLPMLKDPVLEFLDTLGLKQDPVTRRQGFVAGHDQEEDAMKYTCLVSTAHCAISGLPVLLLIDELFELLGGSDIREPAQDRPSRDTATRSPRSMEELHTLLETECAVRWSIDQQSPSHSLRGGGIPLSLEDRIHASVYREIGEEVRRDFESDKSRWIGAHTFPRKPHRKSTDVPAAPQQAATGLDSGPLPERRHNRFIDIVWAPELLPRILRRCKEHSDNRGSVTVQNALFAACNMAWLRVHRRRRTERAEAGREEQTLPMLMYSAINVQPFIPLPASESLSETAEEAAGLGKREGEEEDYAFLGIGYFNVMLPGSLPSVTPLTDDGGSSFDEGKEDRAEFWERARSAKAQANDAVKHPDLLARTILTCGEREARSIGFAIQDDGFVVREALEEVPLSSQSQTVPKAASGKVEPPSAALMGLSLLGRLDAHLRTSAYPRIRPTLWRTGARKAAGGGGVLLMSWSYGGVLTVSVCWDQGALEEGVIDEFVVELREVMAKYVVGSRDGGGEDKGAAGSNATDLLQGSEQASR